MAFDLDYVSEIIRAILRLDLLETFSPEECQQQLWHKRLLAVHCQMAIGEIGQTLTREQETIVNGFIREMVRKYPEYIFKLGISSDSNGNGSKPAIEPNQQQSPAIAAVNKTCWDLAIAISHPEKARDWMAANLPVQEFCEKIGKSWMGYYWLAEAAEKWEKLDLNPPFDLGLLEEP